MLAQPVERQVFTLEERRDDVVIRQARGYHADDCQCRPFKTSGMQQGRSLARPAAGTQHPVCFSRRSASFLNASTCPSTCVVAPSIVATIGSADFDRL